MTTAHHQPRQRATAAPQRPGALRQSGRHPKDGQTSSRRRPQRSSSGTANGRSTAARPARKPSASQHKVRAERRPQARRRYRGATILWSAAALAAAGLIIATMMISSGSGVLQHNTVRTAPGFTLPSTNGKTVSLASYRGHDVVLYFNEGVGCGACFYQMREFEQHATQLAKAGISILPIVMNPASQIRPELASYGLHTPYLIDATGSVSRAYGVLGKGMHAGLPGHGFVLIDAHGKQRWYGEYPSMYLATARLIKQVHAHLGT